MDKVLEYLRKLTDKVREYLPKVNSIQDSMAIVMAYGILLGIISAALMGAWVWNGWQRGQFDVGQMLAFFSAATGAGPVAAVTFLSIFLVDKNKDGRPDAAEARVEKGCEKK